MVEKKIETKIPIDIKKMSFEEALLELDEIVENLEHGTGKLDKAIESYERGALLKRHCEVKLSEAKTRIEKITVGTDGNITVDSMDIS